MRSTILFLCMLLISFSAYAKETFVIKSPEKTKIGLSTHVSYLETTERFGHANKSFSYLETANWSDSLTRESSYIKGFWLKVTVAGVDDDGVPASPVPFVVTIDTFSNGVPIEG